MHGNCDFYLKMKYLILWMIYTLAVPSVLAGECCLEYVDNFGDYHEETWCENFCCNPTISFLRILTRNTLRCCESETERVDASKRETMCGQWWSKNAWVPAMIALGSISVLALGGFLVWKFVLKGGDKVVPTQTHRTQRMQRSPSMFHVRSVPEHIANPPHYVPPPQPPPQPAPSTDSFTGTRNTLLPPLRVTEGTGPPAGASGSSAPGPSSSVPGTFEQPPSYEQSQADHTGLPQKKW